MANVYDVAAYILQEKGEMTAMKLQKLCYYSHAWHLVWEEVPLFGDRIEAWANGPVVRPLYTAHRGEFRVSKMPDWTKADADNLTEDEKHSVDSIMGFYGEMTAHQLSELTHSERPWASARGDLAPGARSDAQITDSEIAPYYDSLTVAATQA